MLMLKLITSSMAAIIHNLINTDFWSICALIIIEGMRWETGMRSIRKIRMIMANI